MGRLESLVGLIARLAALLGGRLTLWGGIAVLAILAAIYAKFFSSSATLTTLKVKEAATEAATEQEAKGLKDDYRRIDRDPHQTGKELLDQLNESARRLRHRP